jgi:hypothetical protein
MNRPTVTLTTADLDTLRSVGSAEVVASDGLGLTLVDAGTLPFFDDVDALGRVVVVHDRSLDMLAAGLTGVMPTRQGESLEVRGPA